jgi:hypothetical protein
MLAMFFINDASHWDWWRLKWHSIDKFRQFVWSWSVMIKSPCDLWDTISYNLPPMQVNKEIVKVENKTDSLFAVTAIWLSETREARKDSIQQRLDRVLEIVKEHKDEQILILKLLFR